MPEVGRSVEEHSPSNFGPTLRSVLECVQHVMWGGCGEPPLGNEFQTVEHRLELVGVIILLGSYRRYLLGRFRPYPIGPVFE